ncbi:hypothetical protein SmJEL517_g02515 [Synchytrium microbalum]|uniref:MIOS-like alpha-solenoid domain-containing protein n=1 Tax=Synchytrium microbalum TaxID=1806994 RepID=A0A507C790_9FUNG|nr:uncharacterized protein SmJEL517_g02515 [Synchytrium microbalum]TPX34999.1 hypothetical protein SmJEL517_g02515 [Synchytrium microbalum]
MNLQQHEERRRYTTETIPPSPLLANVTAGSTEMVMVLNYYSDAVSRVARFLDSSVVKQRAVLLLETDWQQWLSSIDADLHQAARPLLLKVFSSLLETITAESLSTVDVVELGANAGVAHREQEAGHAIIKRKLEYVASASSISLGYKAISNSQELRDMASESLTILETHQVAKRRNDGYATLVEHPVQWCPKLGSTKFLVGGAELRLYEWQPMDEADSKVTFRTLAVNGDSTLMKCFAWSPNPNIENLVAIGYTTGKTSLVQFSSENRSGGLPRSSSAPSLPPSMARLGSSSSLVGGAPSNTANMLNSHIIADYVTRNARACNAVAFCPTDHRLLASGLDKVRSDHCLFVWDTSLATAASPSSGNVGGAQWKSRPDLAPESLQRVSSNTSVNSLTELASSNRMSGSLEIGDSVSSLDWLSNGSPRIVAGMGAKIRIFDLKAPNQTQPISINTKAVHFITADPFHAYRFASCELDGTIRLWDCRKPTEAALTFPSDDRSGMMSLSWSPIRQGLLASLGRDASVVKIWNIQEGAPKEVNTWGTFADDNNSIRSLSLGISGTTQPFIARPDQERSSPSVAGTNSPDPSEPPEDLHYEPFPDEVLPSAPVLWRVRTVKPAMGAPVGFSWMPFASETDFSHRIIVAHNKDPIFEIVHLQESLKIAWRPQGQLATTAGKIVSLINPSERMVMFGVARSDDVSRKNSRPSVANKMAYIDTDISVLMRTRAGAGYGMDAKKNLELAEHPALKELWALVVDAQTRASSNGTTLEKTDYSFKGIANVVEDMATSSTVVTFGGLANHQGHSRNTSLSSSPTKAEFSASALTPTSYLPFKIYSNPYRKLALIMCGFGFDGDYTEDPQSGNFERRLREMENDRDFEKAAGWAFFHASNLSRAVQALNSSQDERLKLVAAALAGYSNFQFGGSANLWKELTESLSRELEGPYIRAMFGLMSSNGNWSTVLDGPDEDGSGNRGLPIRDRIAIALRYLTDEQLTAYIRKTTQKMRQTGNIEGLLLTGLTSSGVDLFEEFVDRTGDVQSACMVMSLVVPRRFTDYRVESWVDNYRLLLDRWQLFRVRAQFDIARRRYMPNEPIGEAVVPAQVYVRCNFCNQSIANGPASTPRKLQTQPPTPSTPHPQPMQNQPRSKVTVCPNPKCGQPLPRCSLCLLALGTATENLQSFAKKSDGSALAGFDLWFSLDTFGDLIKQHDETDPKGTKHFIIARVQTWDAKQPGKAFYSYYNAFHLNKILFQTQVYLGRKLIHRLHVLNPLTNSDIIGNVQYFKVRISRPPQPSRTAPSTPIKDLNGDDGNGRDERKILATAYVDDTQSTNPTTPASNNGKPGLRIQTKPNAGRFTAFMDRASLSAGPRLMQDDDVPLPSPGVREVENGHLQSWTLRGPEVSEVGDDEGLTIQGSGSKSKLIKAKKLPGRALSLKPVARRASYQISGGTQKDGSVSAASSTDRKSPGQLEQGPTSSSVSPIKLQPKRLLILPSVKEQPLQVDTFEIKLPFNSMHSPVSAPLESIPNQFSPPTSPPMKSATAGSVNRSMSIQVRQPMGPVNLRKSMFNRAAVQPGAVTRFGEPIPLQDLTKLVPKSSRNRRRALSYLNAVTAAGQPATYEEWLEMVRQDKASSPVRLELDVDDTDDYDLVRPFGGSAGADAPKSPIVRVDPPKSPLIENNNGKLTNPPSPQKNDIPLVRLESSASPGSLLPYNMYDAILFATDNDFLEGSKTRVIFRENACTVEDAALFEMPPFTGEESPVLMVVEEHPLCSWCFPTIESVRGYSPCIRFLHQFKCYLFALLLMFGMFLFIFLTLKNASSAKLQ